MVQIKLPSETIDGKYGIHRYFLKTTSIHEKLNDEVKIT